MDCFRHKTFRLLLLVAIFLPYPVLAGPGTTGAQILNLGGGARATALGDAFSAMSGDVTTSFWNPSGLANMPESKLRSGKTSAQASMFYTNAGSLFGEAGEGVYYTFISGAMPLGEVGTIGTTLQLQGQGTIAVTTDSPEILREESLGTNFALTFSYADRVTESLSAGINGKMIRMVLGRENGSSYAVDLGMQYRLPFDSIPTTLGVAIQNVGPSISFIDENQSDPLPRYFRIGTAMTLHRGKYNLVRLVSGVTAYIHTLGAKEDEESQVALAKYNETLKQKGKDEVTREQWFAERGVGIYAFRWRNIEKSIGIEYWLGDILAMRIGYKSDPYGFTLPSLSEHFTDGFKFANAVPFLLDLSEYFTYGIGVKLFGVGLDMTYGPRLGPHSTRRFEVTGSFIF